MLAEVLIGVTPITLICVAVVLVPARLLLSSPWSWRKSAVLASLTSAIGAGGLFTILAVIFSNRIRLEDGVAAALIAAVQAALLVWLLASVSRLAR